jgi:hypothetical protein
MSGSGDIIICNGVGPVLRQDTITIPHYENGICIIAWEPPAGMSQHDIDKYTKRLQKLHDLALDVIADATGGTIYPKP